MMNFELAMSWYGRLAQSFDHHRPIIKPEKMQNCNLKLTILFFSEGPSLNQSVLIFIK